jgi:outer membrane protein assembly factor BamD (BamD/ComL family)
VKTVFSDSRLGTHLLRPFITCLRMRRTKRAGRDQKIAASVPIGNPTMSISPVSSASTAPQQSSNASNFWQTFKQLQSALQSGNLSAAQSAYSTLSQSQAAQGNGPFSQVLQQIGQALQSGDLSGAQSALSSFQQQVRGHHHHHGGAQSTQAASGTSADNDADDASSAASSGTTTSTQSNSGNVINVSA